MGRILDAEQIDKLLFKNAKRFQSPGWFFAENTNLDEPKDWEKARFRILIQFMSNGETRAVSSTDIALLSQIKQKGHEKDIFVDVCFLPNQHNAEILDEINVPWSFGNVSHHPIHDYDLVLASNSTVDEKYNIIAIWDKSDFPMWATERMKYPSSPDGYPLPLVLYGGAGASEGEPLYGSSADGKNKSLVDVTYVGMAEPHLFQVVEKLLAMKEAGTYDNKPAVIESLYEFPCIYNPLAYVHHLGPDNWTITKIEKVDQKAPTKVKAAKVTQAEVNEHPGFVVKTLYNDGNYDSVDGLISYGCSGGSVCSFQVSEGTRVWSEFGLKKIEDLVGMEGFEVDASVVDVCEKVFKMTLSDGYTVTTDLGSKLVVDVKHIWMVLSGTKLVEKRTEELELGDVILLKRGLSFDPRVYQKFEEDLIVDEDVALFAGFVMGDGCVDKPCKNWRIQVFVKPHEEEIIAPIMSRLIPKYWRGFQYKSETTELACLGKTGSRVSKLESIFGWSKKWIPECIFSSPKVVMAAYLRGLFMADGWTSGSPGLTTVSSQLAHDVQELLLACGIVSSVNSYKSDYGDGCVRSERWHVSIRDIKDFLRIIKPVFVRDVRNINGVGRAQFPLNEELRTWLAGVRHKTRTTDYDLGGVSQDTVSAVFLREAARVGGALPGELGKFVEGFFPVVIRSIEKGSAVQMFDLKTRDTHHCVFGGHLTHQCHEAGAHAWREKSLEKIIEDVTTARNRSIAHTYSSYSFNANFHSRYEDIMAFASKLFPKVSSISMRADEIAARPDYFKMDKYLGIVRMTLGVEGVSDRIRNGYLNKSLSREATLNAARACFANRFMQVKLFFILSGREEQSDWEEGVQLVTDIINLRNSLGGNTHVKVSFSLLCHYPHTAIAWDERLSIKHTITGGRISYFIDECRKLGVGVRFSSRGKSVVFQQLNLDVGRPLTAVFEKLYRRTGWVYFRNVPDAIVENMEDIIKEQGLPDTMTILSARPYDWIFPSSTIFVRSEKFLIEESKRINSYTPQAYCLRTQAKPVDHKCASCGLCESKKVQDGMVNRPIDQSVANVDDIIIAMSFNKPYHRYRFVFDTPRKYDFLKKRPLGHFFFTKFFSEEEKAKLYAVETGSDYSRWNMNSELTYPFYGKFILDVSTREDLGELALRDLKDPMILKPLSITKVPVNFEIKTSDLAMVVLETSPMPLIIDAFRAKGDIGYPYIKNDFPLEWDVEEGCGVAPLLKKAESFKLLLMVPVRTNLIKYLANLTGRTYYKVLEDVHLSTQVLGVYRQIKGGKCALCGEDALMDLTNGKMLAFCPSCMQKLIFKKL